uniref:RT06580p n=1 Tax=Drosophila melanogaster TaxID=7227 RepID=D3PK88_DROME|nr:RT06580p [Drosophila melanogaster]
MGMIEMLALGSVSVAPNAWPFSMVRAQTRLTIDPTLAFRLLIVLPQIVAGLAFPIKQADTVQSVWGFVNYQAQYVPSPVPIYWWSFWNTSTFLSTAREWRKGIRSRVFQDETRVWLYDVVETGLERLGDRNAGACLLKCICEISQRPFMHNSIFGEILNAVLVPSLDNVPEKYLHARNAGKAGANCRKTYSDCSKAFWNKLIQMARITI